MKILVIGSGAREHAMTWKINQSEKVDEIFVAPGNAGIAEVATCVDIPADDVQALYEFALKENIDLTAFGSRYCRFI
jgi:phosphoribosylamine--glycine ligase